MNTMEITNEFPTVCIQKIKTPNYVTPLILYDKIQKLPKDQNITKHRSDF